MRTDECREQARHDHDVHDQEPADDVLRRELSAENEERQPRSHHGYRQRHRVGDAKPGSGQEIVGHRVAGEALEDPEQQHRHPDDPVELAGSAERAREEDPHQVGNDGGDEHQRGPVVHLPEHQPAPDLEADPEDARVGLRHRGAVERAVRAVVDDLARRRLEEEREERSREDQDDEAVQGDLAQHERPVVRKDLVQRVLREARRPEAVVEPARDALRDHPGPSAVIGRIMAAPAEAGSESRPPR